MKNYTNLNAFINVNSLNNTLKNDKNITPRNLFIIIAYLVKRKILKIEDIWSHMGPSDQEIEENYNKRVELANKHFKSVYTIKLKQDSEQKKKAKEQEQIEVLEIYNQNICNIYYNIKKKIIS